MVKKKLLILGPAYRRNPSEKPLTAIERYDGIYFKVTKKYIRQVRNVDVVVMVDDLTLIDSNSLLPYFPPKGDVWSKHILSNDVIKEAKKKNEIFLSGKLKNEKYSEIFISMGKKHAHALPDLSHYNVIIVFPTHGGIGPKAKALKDWFLKLIS